MPRRTPPKIQRARVPQAETYTHTFTSSPALIEIAQRVAGAIDHYLAMMRAIDQLLGQYAVMLDTIQPHAPGKLGIRSIRPRQDAYREPTFVAWKKYPSTGRLEAYAVLPLDAALKSVQIYGPFKNTAEDVRMIVRHARRLIERRRDILRVFTELTQNAGRRRHHTQAANEREGQWLTDNYPGIADRHLARVAAWRARQEQTGDAAQAQVDPDIPPRQPRPTPGRHAGELTNPGVALPDTLEDYLDPDELPMLDLPDNPDDELGIAQIDPDLPPRPLRPPPGRHAGELTNPGVALPDTPDDEEP